MTIITYLNFHVQAQNIFMLFHFLMQSTFFFLSCIDRNFHQNLFLNMQCRLFCFNAHVSNVNWKEKQEEEIDSIGCYLIFFFTTFFVSLLNHQPILKNFTSNRKRTSFKMTNFHKYRQNIAFVLRLYRYIQAYILPYWKV